MEYVIAAFVILVVIVTWFSHRRRKHLKALEKRVDAMQYNTNVGMGAFDKVTYTREVPVLPHVTIAPTQVVNRTPYNGYATSYRDPSMLSSMVAEEILEEEIEEDMYIKSIMPEVVADQIIEEAFIEEEIFDQQDNYDTTDNSGY